MNNLVATEIVSKPILAIVLAPSSEGRPEGRIAEALIKATSNEFEVITFPNKIKSVSPKNGIDFYDARTTISHYRQAEKELLETKYDISAILFIDGLNSIAQSYVYYCRMLGRKIPPLYAIFHSSANTPGDRFFYDNKIKSIEDSLMKIYKNVFVATETMATQLPSPYSGTYSKIEVVGLPLDYRVRKFHNSGEKFRIQRNKNYKPRVIWPHRMAEDKNWEHFYRFANAYSDTFNFVVVSPVPATKEQLNQTRGIGFVHAASYGSYLHELRASDIVFSCATLETFGYAVLEGVLCGCIPVLNNHPVYREMYNEKCLYKSDLIIKDNKELAIKIMQVYETFRETKDISQLIMPDTLSRLQEGYSESKIIEKIKSAVDKNSKQYYTDDVLTILHR